MAARAKILQRTRDMEGTHACVPQGYEGGCASKCYGLQPHESYVAVGRADGANWNDCMSATLLVRARPHPARWTTANRLGLGTAAEHGFLNDAQRPNVRAVQVAPGAHLPPDFAFFLTSPTAPPGGRAGTEHVDGLWCGEPA
jgi:hypothetical protein